jgi:hypothetical protein
MKKDDAGIKKWRKEDGERGGRGPKSEEKWSKNVFRLSDGNSDFSRDLILKKAL